MEVKRKFRLPGHKATALPEGPSATQDGNGWNILYTRDDLFMDTSPVLVPDRTYTPKEVGLAVVYGGTTPSDVVDLGVSLKRWQTDQQGNLELIATVTPYHPDWPMKARLLGGRWRAESKVWVFDAQEQEQVRQAMLEVYGCAGPLTRDEVFDAEVTLGAGKYGRTLWGLGRQLATRREARWQVRLGKGVSVQRGGFTREGGTMFEPDLAPEEATVLSVKDVPTQFWDDVPAEDLFPTYPAVLGLRNMTQGGTYYETLGRRNT